MNDGYGGHCFLNFEGTLYIDGCHSVDRKNYSLYFQMNYGLLLYFKLTRVVMGNVSKKGEKYRRYYYLKYFY